MALEKQVVSFPLTEGLDTKTDPKALPLPKLILLENARRDKAGRISKRFGNRALGRAVTGSTSTTEDADALGTFNDELLIFAKQSLYSYSESAGISSDKGGCVAATMTVDDVTRNNAQQKNIDVAVNNEIALVAYEDTRNSSVGVWATIMDNATGAILLNDYLVSASGICPRCVAFGNYLYLFYIDSADLKVVKFNPYDPLDIPAAVVISSSIDATSLAYDVVPFENYMVFALHLTGTSGLLRVSKLDTDLNVGASITTGDTSGVLGPISLVKTGNQYLIMMWYGGSNRLRRIVFDVNLSIPSGGSWEIETLANIKRITGYALPDGSGAHFFYEVSAAATYNTFIKQVTITNTAVTGTPSVFLRSVGIATKAWAHSADTSNHGFIGVVHESTLQSTFFVARNDGMIVGKAQSGTAGGLIATARYPSSVALRSPGKFQFGVLSKRKIGSDGSDFVTLKGTSLVTVDFSDLRNFSTAQLAGNALIVGGLVQGYDSQSAVEHGFHLFPENITAAPSATGGSALTLLGTYSYQVCYEWVDGKGQVHRSAPSVPVAITLTSSDDTVTLTIPTLRLTQKRGSSSSGPRRDNCQIVVYRTETLGSVYYQASSPTSPTYNNPSADTITFVDTLPDATLISRQPLYTTGDILENIAPPSASLVATYRNRVLIGGTEDDTVWFSKQVRPNRPVEFNDAFTIKVDPVGGRLKAIATLDDKAIFFKENSIYFTSGDGPNDFGEGDVFIPPELVTTDAGCVDSKSVVQMPLGLMHKSRKGYYLLTRDLQSIYVGSEVEEWNDYSVTAATLIADSNEVRFSTEMGPVLVYNYLFKQWSVWPTFYADDAISWKNRFVAIKRRSGSTALVVQEEPDFFLDVDQAYRLRIGLAWASFAGIQGTQRVWRAVFLGDYKSPHTLKLSVGYNFTPVISDEYYWDPVSRMGITEFGDGAYYGTDPVFGGESANNGTYQVRVHIVQQKCQALRFILEDISPADNYEGFSLTGVAFEVGVKKGTAKLQAAQTL